jgi:4-hydroxybenzoate polyprenyltransferase
MKAILKLIRWPNLLIIVFAMSAMHYALIGGMIKHYTIQHYSFLRKEFQILSFNFELQYNHLGFGLLVLSVVLVAIGGYIINDIFDRKSDALNKKKRNMVGTEISEKLAYLLYISSTFAGVILGFFLSYQLGVWQIGFIFALTAGLLYFYSADYQSVPVLGNFFVAIMLAIVPMLVPAFDILALNKVYKPTLLNYGFTFNFLWYWTGGFAFFAFLSSFIREIIKDTQDFEGDKAIGQNTLPIFIGTTYTKVIIISLSILLLSCVLVLNYVYFPEHLMMKYNYSPEDVWWQKISPSMLSGLYIWLFIVLPSILLIYVVWRADNAKDYHFASALVKLLMIFGISYTFIIAFTFLNFQILIQ